MIPSFATAIPPALHAQPVRHYPLHPVNEPAVFVLGEKAGQKVMLSQGPPVPPGVPGPPPQAPPNANFGGRGDPQAMIVHQNREMEVLERRSQRDRSGSMSQVRSAKHIYYSYAMEESVPMSYGLESTAASSANRRGRLSRCVGNLMFSAAHSCPSQTKWIISQHVHWPSLVTNETMNS